MKNLEDYIRVVPDYPEKGVQFRDISTVVNDKDGFRIAIASMIDLIKDTEYDSIAGVESRGFILGGPIAYELRKPMVMIRKKGKLPCKTVSQKYDLEYGTAEIEIHEDSIKPGQKVVLVDDLIATGGSIEAAAKLVEKLGGEVAKIICLIELDGFNARERLSKYDVEAVLRYNGK